MTLYVYACMYLTLLVLACIYGIYKTINGYLLYFLLYFTFVRLTQFHATTPPYSENVTVIIML